MNQLRSATLTLTAYYLIIVAAISIGFSTLLYQVAMDDLAYGLHRQTQRISNDFPVFSDSPYLRSDTELAEGSRHIIGRLVIANLAVFVLAGGASYILAGRTLKPIADSHARQERFVADVSHELRTPLTALTMESEVVLLDTAATKQQLRSVVTSTIEEANKLNTLVSNLLRLSQLDQPGDALANAPIISLSDPIAAAISQLQPVAAARQIAITTALADNIRISGDGSSLTQLGIILLDNAIKYSPDGATVTVAVDTKDGYARAVVTDHGAGISKQQLDHVFERFYRADSSRSGAGGFGLGLSIAKLIAESHRGNIQLSSQPGKGTIASLLLPIAVSGKQRSSS